MVWLLLAGLALAEQVEVLVETSSHDEQALSALAFAIKPGAASRVDDAGNIAIALPLIEPVRSSFALFGVNSDKSDCPLLSHPSLALFIALSCYRI